MNSWHQYELVFKPMHSRTESPSSRLVCVWGGGWRDGQSRNCDRHRCFFFFFPFWQSCIKRVLKWERISLTVHVCVCGRASAFHGSYLAASHSFHSPSFLYVSTPAFPPPNPHSIDDTYSRLLGKIELHPPVAILLSSRRQSFCHICFILLSISLCRSHLTSPRWLFYCG